MALHSYGRLINIQILAPGKAANCSLQASKAPSNSSSLCFHFHWPTDTRIQSLAVSKAHLAMSWRQAGQLQAWRSIISQQKMAEEAVEN